MLWLVCVMMTVKGLCSIANSSVAVVKLNGSTHPLWQCWSSGAELNLGGGADLLWRYTFLVAVPVPRASNLTSSIMLVTGKAI